MKYYIETFGCQLNISDSERISKEIEKMGYKKTSIMNEADLIIINMCSIRQSAVNRVVGKAEKIKRLKSSKSILTGCILRKDIRIFRNSFNYILSIRSLPYWKSFLKKEKRVYYPNPLESEPDISYFKIEPLRENNFSVLIPISSGCNNFCSYCVVPYTRGREVSRDPQDILKEVKNAVKNEAKEIWLLGQNVNSYNSKGVKFPEILRKVNKIKGNFWIRLTSPHPRYFSDDLIKTMKECEKITEYLNLPMQSGDNEILKKMNRPYTIEKYKRLVKEIRKAIPDIFLSTDIIVGFPCESEKNFENTLKILKEIRFGMAYISRYSKRKNTTAEKMKDDVLEKEKKKREKILTEALEKISLKNNREYVDKNLKVLVDKYRRGFSIGKDRHYRTVKFKSEQNFKGKFVKVKITKPLPWGLEGKIIKNGK